MLDAIMPFIPVIAIVLVVLFILLLGYVKAPPDRKSTRLNSSHGL